MPWSSLRRLATRLLEAVREYRHHHGALGPVLAASVGVQVLRVMQAYFLGVPLGIASPLSAYFVAIPVILLIMLLPITMNGIGTSQAAFIWCFGAMGVGRPEAFALSILFVALGIVGNLPGGLLYADRGHGTPDRMIGTASARILIAILTATVAWTTGVPGILLYLLCWIVVCAPGIPLGIRAFGRGGVGLDGRRCRWVRRDEPRMVGGDRGAPS